MRCSKCGADNREGARFCDKCGAKFSPRCPSCGAENRTDAKFCDSCGAAFGADATVAAPAAKMNDTPIRVTETSAAENLEGERKTVTVLFADIKGSMELIEDLDPEEARAVVDPALKLMMEAVQRYGGYVSQSTGDGIFALFGAPVAHEDHPQRALYSALRMQEELKRYSDRIRSEGRLPIQARVGVNTGEVVVRSITTGEGRSEYVPVGHSAGIAARMQALAPVGSIAATEQIRKLCEGYFLFKSLGPTKVKGVSEPVNVFEVTGMGPLRTRLQRSAARGYTKFVGREREIEALRRAAEQARAGRGQIVAVVAEPGVGKSRLFFEFKAKNQSSWMVLEAFSVSHGKASAYLPLLDLLHTYFDIKSDDDARKRREKVTGRVLAPDRTLEDTLPYLFALLGIVEGEDPLAQIDANVRKRRTLEGIKRILLRESLSQLLIVMFEDLHVIDEQTQEFLNLLADSLANAKILFLVNYRPEYSHQWGSKTYYTQIRLDPLGTESADEMLTALLGDAPEMVPLKKLIIERTEGNPFFMEEIYQVLLDEGALVRNGVTRLIKLISELKIPPTVQGTLAARIDRLPADAKDLLQALSVIGRQFSMSLVRAVVPKSDDELERMLNSLQLSEFIYEQPAVGDTEFIFKHALTQEVASTSVLQERRKLMHERIGAAVEALYADRIEDHLANLARHYARSANPAKAVEYCLRACRQCVERASYADAVTHFETGLARLQELPDDARRAELELDLRIASLESLITIKGYGSLEGEGSASRALELCRQTGTNWKDLWFALRGLYTSALLRPDLRRAHEMAAEMVALAKQHASAEHLADALGMQGFANLTAGAFEPAAVAFDRAIAIYESTPTAEWERLLDDPYTPVVGIPAVSAWNQCCLGHLDQALERIVSATALARKADSRTALEAVHTYAISVFDMRCEFERMRERAEALVAVSIALGNLFRRARAEILLGWTEVVSGELKNGLARMQQNLAAFRATGSEATVDYFLALIATALGRMGQFDEALRTIEEAFPVIKKTDAHWHEAEVYRRKGELLLAQDSSNVASAERCFRTAIEVARKQHGKLWELRASTSLARLLRDTNRRDEARTMLAEIHNWFTEGFDTADLKDAKALVDELSRSP
jgi:class 3 adenylate cyclase/tetratricopeptide (TPR) repeat protein